MIIDVGDYVESDSEDVETTTFSQHKGTYALNSNPLAKDNSDTRILMINSKTSTTQSNIQEKQGFKSNTIKLEANSYYVFSISAKTMLNGDDFAECSIYLSGLKDKDGKDFDLGYEKVSPTSWTDYYFFVATGDESQEVSLQLYLGSKNTTSEGVVFFDGTNAHRYSENEFYELCKAHNYTSDSKEITNGEKIFMLDKLASDSNSVADISSYNFDFENEDELLTDSWTVIAHPNGNASIINYADFEATTGYSKIGNDLSYQNDRALVMQTSSSEYSSSYIGLRSGQIQIQPHASYRVSLKLKIADMTSGSFYLKLTENDYIYQIYSSQISDDKEADNYLEIKNGQTSGYTSNVANNWTNDYQTVDFYVKGHSLYTSYVNIELWLGDSQTSAVGCVVIDDIDVEMVADSEINSANCLTLTSTTESGDIDNFSFNTATSDSNKLEYPLMATGWTSEVENDTNCESGVVYLDGNIYDKFLNATVYDIMYDGKYDWAGINPGNSNKTTAPSNVYMMFNRTNSYQSLKSPTFALSGNEYYKVSFNYYNQLYSTTNPSSFKVEVVDENGIVLFSQDKIQNLDNWATMDIYFKANSSNSQTVYLKVYFGEEESKVGGMLYLDNFTLTTADENGYNLASYKTDTTGFFTKLDLKGENTNKVVSSSAYTFSASSLDTNYTDSEVAFGGIASGTNNTYDITNENDNLLVITTTAPSKASLTSNFTLNFDASSYYKLTFSLTTIFNEGADNASTDEHTCNYGVSILLNGYEEIANLVTDGTLKEYTIYFKTSDSSTTPTLEFILNSDCDATTGTAILTNLALESTDEDTYVYALTKPSYNESVFSSEYVEESVEEEEEEQPEDTTESTDNSSVWLAVSALITGVALIVAIVGLVLRKVKIKKIEKIKSEVYDRRLNQNHELVMAQAQKLRDKEVEDLINARESIENEKASLENEHKDYMRTIRDEKQGKISKEVEKRFKQYTSRVASLNEKINIIKEKLDFTMSADHLIELERKIIAQQDEASHKHKKRK
ncbi:MAG: hypothetical protein IJZ62_03245 [Clostridia bacterium]|nr:hypothetical protein [Clostridia bacterium]